MPYVDPSEVVGPRKTWKTKRIEFSTGRGTEDEPGWSVASGLLNGTPALAMRWNGRDGDSGPGSPQSRGFPTWFIIPAELAPGVMREIARLRMEREGLECVVESPDEYSPGAWRIEIRLSGKTLEAVGPSFFFFFPKQAHWMFNAPNVEHRNVRDRGNGAELGGQFKDGVWKGDLYTYELNTRAESVANEIREMIIASIKAQMAGDTNS